MIWILVRQPNGSINSNNKKEFVIWTEITQFFASQQSELGIFYKMCDMGFKWLHRRQIYLCYKITCFIEGYILILYSFSV